VEPKVAADMVTYTVVSVSRCQCSSTRQCPHASIMIESVMGGTCDLGWDLGMGPRGVWRVGYIEHRGLSGLASRASRDIEDIEG
jgi:hypothetical protein